MGKRKKTGESRAGKHKYALVGLRLPDDLREEAQAMANSEERSLSQMCQILVREALAARKENKK
jgi:hypothetical protein